MWNIMSLVAGLSIVCNVSLLGCSSVGRDLPFRTNKAFVSDIPLPVKVDAEYEIQVAASQSGALLAGTMVGSLENWRCNFKTSNTLGVSWGKDVSHRHPSYQIAGNPTVGIDTAGTMYAVCMSANLDYSSGILEIARSNDDGRTWTDWKAIPGITGLPDKPWIAVSSDEISISYSHIERSTLDAFDLTITIEIIRSRDGGETWSAPQKLSIDGQHNRCEHTICGDQGSYLEYLGNGDLAISWGGYGGNSVFFARIPHGSNEPAIAEVSSEGADVPITQFKASRDGTDLNVYWYPAHDFGPSYYAYSADSGRSWVKQKLSDSSTAVAAQMGVNDNLYFLWLEKTGDKSDVKLMQTNQGIPSGLSISVIGGEFILPADIEYLGGYQSLNCTSDNRLTAFFIDLHGAQSQITRNALDINCDN